jgi:hypothetical protein
VYSTMKKAPCGYWSGKRREGRAVHGMSRYASPRLLYPRVDRRDIKLVKHAA